MDDYKKTENIIKNNISNKHIYKATNRPKNVISNKYIQVIALLFAILFTVSVGILICTEVNTISKFFVNEKIMDETELIHTLQAAQPSGVYSEEPVVYNIKVNDIMKIYFVFFLGISLFPLSFFVSWRLLSDWNIRKYKNGQQTAKNAGYPELVSVISPAYNEEKSIGRCVEALLSQDYEGAMEIIVVNDGSSDRTAEIVSRYPVKLIDLKKNGGKANALNRGLKKQRRYYSLHRCRFQYGEGYY